LRGSGSAPTERVLDVVELLSRPGIHQVRFSDVVRELDLSQGTAHAILKTLSDRGWVIRDAATKTFTLGPALTLVASGLDAGRPLTRVARDAVRRLAETTDMPASVVERTGDDLVITAFEHPTESSAAMQPNERIPYAPPFGIAFAAWDTADEQEAWMARGAAGDAGLRQRLRTVLTRTRERGYDVDWMTPALSQAAQAIGTLSGDAIPHNLRSVIDQLRVEFASANSMPDDSTRGAHPIATISAPVLDADDRIALVLAIHPLRAMTIREIRSAAKPLLREVAQVGNRREPEGASHPSIATR
jgi:DNA-binding IclR family transcriptional regulator